MNRLIALLFSFQFVNCPPPPPKKKIRVFLWAQNRNQILEKFNHALVIGNDILQVLVIHL